MKRLAVYFAATILIATCALAADSTTQPLGGLQVFFAAHSNPLIFDGQRIEPAQQCCKVCHEGKACGNTCIERSDTCHVSGGCACDG
jgi:hypothetical protein